MTYINIINNMSNQKKIQNVNKMLDCSEIIATKFGDIGKHLIADFADIGKKSIKKEMYESDWYNSPQAQQTENILRDFFSLFGGDNHQVLHNDEITGWLKQ